MNWGNRIILSFVLFAVFITAMVVISMNQDISLESEDYYKKEIEYQDQINREKNTAALKSLPVIEYSKAENKVFLKFHPEDHYGFSTGNIHFFSHLTSGEDKVFNLDKSAFPDYMMDVSDLRSGKWEIRLNWSDGDKEYYFEKILFL